MKFMGGSVKRKVLRENEVSRIFETLNIEVILDQVPGQAHIVPIIAEA